jgi:hypothetical protein
LQAPLKTHPHAIHAVWQQGRRPGVHSMARDSGPDGPFCAETRAAVAAMGVCPGRKTTRWRLLPAGVYGSRAEHLASTGHCWAAPEGSKRAVCPEGTAALPSAGRRVAAVGPRVAAQCCASPLTARRLRWWSTTGHRSFPDAAALPVKTNASPTRPRATATRVQRRGHDSRAQPPSRRSRVITRPTALSHAAAASISIDACAAARAWVIMTCIASKSFPAARPPASPRFPSAISTTQYLAASRLRRSPSSIWQRVPRPRLCC